MNAEKKGELKVLEFLHQGGTIMYVIVGLSVIALGLIIDRFYAYATLGTDTVLFLKEVDEFAERDAIDEAVSFCGASKALVAALAAELLENRHLSLPALRKLAVTEIDLRHQPFLQHRLNLLSTIAKAAPMLGLFGTVWGMMGAFDQIAGQAQANPKELAGDIAVALNTTFGGLAVAIPIVFALTYFRSRTQQLEIDLERCSMHMQDLIGRLAGGR